MSADRTGGADLNATTVRSPRVEIDAPAELVWQVLTDFGAYPEWNPFVVRCDTTGAVGDPVLLHLPDPATDGATFTTQEWITVSTPPHHLQYQTGDSIPGMLAIRDQWVDDLGAGRSAYETTDVFSGDIAQVVFDLQVEWVTAGFTATAHALKARAESLVRAGS